MPLSAPNSVHHLPQCQVQNFIQIERLRRHHRHRIQRIQFPVAPPHLIFGAALLGHVQHESLVAFDIAGRVTRGKAAFNAPADSVPSLRRRVTSKLRT